MSMTGGCLCGSVRYEVTGEPALTGVCHCRDCQKQTGTSFSIVMGLPAGALKTSGALASFVTHGVSGHGVDRFFCGKCGSPVYSNVGAMPGVVFLKAGTLDDPSALSPTVHLWCETKQPWVVVDPALPQFPQNPPMG